MIMGSVSGQMRLAGTPPSMAQLLFLASDRTPGLTVHPSPGWDANLSHPLVGKNNVTGLAVSPDGNRIAVLQSYPRSLTVYSIATGTTVFTTSTVGSTNYYGITWSPDGALIAVPTGGSPYVRLYNAVTGAVITGLPTFTQGCYGVAFSPDSTRLAMGFYDAPKLSVLDIPTKTLVGGVSSANSVYHLAFSPNGLYLAVAGAGRRVFRTSDWTSVTNGDMSGGDSLATGVVFSAGSDKLLVTRRTGSPKLKLYDVATWTTTVGVDLSALTTACEKPVISPDGSLIAIPLATSATAIITTNDWSINPAAVPPLYVASSATPIAAFS